MKVLHILNELRPSGAEVMLRIAAPFWSEHGLECALLSTGDEPGPYAPELAAAGYRIHHLPRKKRPSHFADVRRLIVQQGYGVVHQHVEAAGYWYSTAALATGAAVVRTVHNNFPFDGWLRLVRGWQRRHLARRGVCFAAIAPGVRANELQRFGLQTELVLNWVAERFMAAPAPAQREQARRELGYADDDFVLVSVGNCSQVKNHAVILHALAACGDLPQLRYLHLGVEEPGHPERQLAARLGVAGKVRFAGWTPDALPLLHAADAYIMPSLFEGLSLAAIEALGTGLPGLLADVPGLADNAAFFPSLIYFAPAAAGAEQAIRQAVAEGAEARASRTRTYPDVCRRHFSARRGVSDYALLYREAGTR
jgi:glycosyltransferase involved in cell wall biosynthesis